MIIEKILEKINKIFKKNNAKMLNEAKYEETKADSNIKMNLSEMVIKKDEKKEKNKDEKIRDILNVAGCDYEIFEKIDNFENIDENNLKLNLMELSKYNFSKIELSKILSQNEELIYIGNDIVKKSLEELEKYIIDKEKIHEIVYLNPYIISENITEILNDKKEIFDKYNISYEIQKNILAENPMIFNVVKEKLESSLNVIKSIFSEEKEFVEFIECEPIIIGCDNLEIVKSYM